MARIEQSVGRGGVNAKTDVEIAQALLNKHVVALGLPLLVVDGRSGTNTVDAIRAYQRRVVGLTATDGRIDPGGRTWQALEAGKGVVAPPVPAGATLSGAAWWHANQARFPNSSRLADLASPFRERAIRFVDALQAAGAIVSVRSTLRHPSRAKLMRGCWDVSRGLASPRDIKAIDGCEIEWDHGNPAASRRAAGEMVSLFGIVHRPSLTSLHIEARAVDMTITWSGTLDIEDAGGRRHRLATPRNGNANPGLHAVGATYGVKKLLSDPPHWSDNGH